MGRLAEALKLIYNIVRAEIYLNTRFLANNKIVLATLAFWPYGMVAAVVVIGEAYGSLEEYSRRLGVADPLVFLIAASGVAFTAVAIMDEAASKAYQGRWLGVNPYIAVSSGSFTIYVASAGVASSIFMTLLTYTMITPAVVALGGLESGLRLAVVVAIVMAGMLPLVPLAVAAAMVSLAMKQDSNVMSFVNPMLLMAAGVFYPVEMLPEVLEMLARLVPVSYVVEAARIVSAFEDPAVAQLVASLYYLALMIVLYNSILALAVGRAERLVTEEGAL